MKKILQKSLASMVSAVLCLTAFVGCLTVNAERGTGTITVGKITEKAGTDIIIPVTITANGDSQGVAAARFDLTYDINLLTINAIKSVPLDNTPAENSLYYYVDYRADADGNIAVITDDDVVDNPFEPSSPEGGSTEGGSTEGGSTEGGSTEGGSTEGGSTEESNVKNGTVRIMAAVRDEKCMAIDSMTVYLYFTIASTAAEGDSTNITLSDVQASDNGKIIGNVEFGRIYDNNEERITMTPTNGSVTVGSTHVHNWEIGRMTVMPTTTYDGIVVKPCSVCGGINPEPFQVPNGSITPSATRTLTDVQEVKVQYGGKIAADVFTEIGNNEQCTVSGFGLLFAKKSITPDFSLPNAKPVITYTNSIPAGKSPTIYYGYKGLSFTQMGQTFTYRAYVKFDRAGQTCYYYGEPYAPVFIDEIRKNKDTQSIALTKLYDDRSSATNILSSCTGTVVKTSDVPGITLSDLRTQLDLTKEMIQYGARIHKSVFAEITSNGGTINSCGMFFTEKDIVPDFTNAKPVYSYTGAIPPGKSLIVYYGYKGLSFTQMGQKYTYRSYIKYTDSNGNVQYIYGETISFVFIDILRSLAQDQGNEYANDLLSYYDTYYGTITN